MLDTGSTVAFTEGVVVLLTRGASTDIFVREACRPADSFSAGRVCRGT